MKTISVTVERNFHILNDDRFIIEKISVTMETDGDESEHRVIDTARQIITDNFKTAYPTVEEHLNFNVVRQVNPLPRVYDAPPYSSNDGEPNFISTAFKEAHGKMNKQFFELVMTGNPTEDKKEEPIDKGFNLIDEINKCKKLSLLKIYDAMCKTHEEHEAYSRRVGELLNEKVTN